MTSRKKGHRNRRGRPASHAQHGKRPDLPMPMPDGGWTKDDVRRLMLNPFYAVEIDPVLATPHQPLVSEEQWIDANAVLIQQMGVKEWLRGVLDVLKGGYVTGANDEDEDEEAIYACEHGHNEVDADLLDDYVGRLLAERLVGHPEALAWPTANPAAFYDSLHTEVAEDVRQLGGTARLAELSTAQRRWEDLDDRDRRLVVAALIKSITIDPEGDVLADRVKICWREKP